MKLILITAINEYAVNIKHILRECNVKHYSYSKVTGFSNSSEDEIEKNWFASEMNENESILFYAFLPASSSETIFTKINEFNQEQNCESKVHVTTLSIDKSN